MQQPSNTIVIITILVIFLALYSRRDATVEEIPEEDISVSLCQVYAQYDAFNDRVLLSILAKLKMHDFQISQPVWGPSDTLVYLCEHRLKTGLKQTIINQELNAIIRSNDASPKRPVWSCA